MLAIALLVATGACSKSCRSASAGGACVVDVVTGDEDTCLKLGDGSYRCRGRRDSDSLTHGKWPGLSAPQPWVAIPSQFKTLRLAAERTCGLDADGTLWCWGRNRYDLESKNITEPNPVAMRKFGSGIQSFEARQENTCVVREGQVFCMGLGADYTKVDQIQGLEPGVVWVGVGTRLGCASTRRDLYCWGAQAWAQPEGSPHEVYAVSGSTETAVHIGTLPDDFAEGALGAAAGCARTRSQRVFCWGSPHSGEWGTGVRARCEKTPCPQYDLRSLHEVAIISGSATHLAGGAATFCVTRTDRSVWCWGNNNNELVSPRTAYDPERKVVSEVDEPLPVQKTGVGTDNAEIHLATAHACVKKVDGTVVCWGSNSYQQIADGACADNACAPRELSYDCSAEHPSREP